MTYKANLLEIAINTIPKYKCFLNWMQKFTIESSLKIYVKFKKSWINIVLIQQQIFSYTFPLKSSVSKIFCILFMILIYWQVNNSNMNIMHEVYYYLNTKGNVWNGIPNIYSNSIQDSWQQRWFAIKFGICDKYCI